jgi:beta-D-xylosidase 4
MGMRPNASTGYEGRTHRFYTGSTVFKFGDGLSYSAWTHTNAATASASVSSTLSIDLAAAKAQLEATRNAPHTATALTTVQIDVRNDGPLRGDHVVLAFLSAPLGVAGVDGAPLQSLATYSRLGDVAVNATRRVEFAITAHHIANALGAVRDAASGEMKLEIRKGAYVLRVGSGAEALRLELVVS